MLLGSNFRISAHPIVKFIYHNIIAIVKRGWLMLKVFHSDVEKFSIIRWIDNLFFIGGGVFLLLGLYSSNIILSIYGLTVMFISLYAIHHIYEHHEVGGITSIIRHGTKDKHTIIIAKLNELVSNEKKLQQEVEKNQKEIIKLIPKIKDKGVYNKVITRLRAEKHAKERTRTIVNEDARRALLLADSFLSHLPKEHISKFIKSRSYKIYNRVIERIR